MRHAAQFSTVATLLVAASAHAQYLTPNSYLSFQDSPFRTTGFQQFWLENFEDNLLNTPGVTYSGGQVQFPGPNTDSVDADDGVIDGLGTAGRSFRIGYLNPSTRFTFSRVNGLLPTHVGAVWTDVGATTFGGFGIGRVYLQAFDADGRIINGPITVDIGDGRTNGNTSEDRFFGIVHLGGISAVELLTINATEWELDHLQYGTIPSPGMGTAPLLAFFAIRRRR